MLLMLLGASENKVETQRTLVHPNLLRPGKDSHDLLNLRAVYNSLHTFSHVHCTKLSL